MIAPARSRAAFLIVVTGIFLARVAVALSASDRDLRSDALEYHRLAIRLAAQELVKDADRPLVYPALVASVYGIADSNPRIVYGVQVLCGIVASLALGLAGRRAYDVETGRLVALLSAGCLHWLQYDSLLLNEAPFLLAWSVALAGLSGRTSVVGFAVAGVSLGAAAGIKPAAIPLVAGVLVWGFVGAARRRPVLALALAFLGTVATGGYLLRAATGLPSRLVPTAGVNLYLGNNPLARLDGGGLDALPPELNRIESPAERNRVAWELALDYALAHPARTIALCAVRLVRIVSAVPGRFEWSSWERRGGSLTLLRFLLPLEWMAIVTLAAVGATASGWIRSPIPLLTAAALPYVSVLAVTFVQSRFKLPLLLPLLLLAGRGVKALQNQEGRTGRRSVIGWALAATCAASLLQLALAWWSASTGQTP